LVIKELEKKKRRNKYQRKEKDKVLALRNKKATISERGKQQQRRGKRKWRTIRKRGGKGQTPGRRDVPRFGSAD